MNSEHIILLHPIYGFSSLLLPIKILLKIKGYKNVHIIKYDSNKCIDKCIDTVHNSMMKKVDLKKDTVIIIGQSFGGVIALELHKKKWNIKKTVSIASPLNGCSILNKIKNTFPKVYETLYVKSFDDIKSKKSFNPPPHDYTTITASIPLLDFDGCLYKDECIIEENRNIHVPYSNHIFILFSPSVLYHLNKIL